MMNNNIIHIKLSDFFLNKIISRSSIDAIFNHWNWEKLIVIDFKDIDFISRTAAHELITQLEFFSNNKIHISIKNLSIDVKKMIDQVEQFKQKKIKHATYVEHIHFDSEKKLDDFLLTI